MTEIDYAARVAKGAALLDEKRPGWEREINLDVLDIADGTRCVTAQLSGRDDWAKGMTQLGLTFVAYAQHGFRVDGDEWGGYLTLNTLWRGLITTRLAVPTDGA